MYAQQILDIFREILLDLHSDKKIHGKLYLTLVFTLQGTKAITGQLGPYMKARQTQVDTLKNLLRVPDLVVPIIQINAPMIMLMEYNDMMDDDPRVCKSYAETD